jgi:dTDP-4-amino-4,6-dideoxygalactose transaminase
VIPFASPAAQYQAHKPAIDAAIGRVLARGNYILGEEVGSFERAFAAYCGVEDAVGVGSGTDALTLTLRALGIGAGDEVITVSHTALATVAAIVAAGATPILADIERDTYTIDPNRIAAIATPRAKAVIVVHLYGRPANMPAILEVAGRFGLAVIEDCAQSAGATLDGKRLGSLGTAGCFSFYPTKNLGAIGDGGMVVTRDAALAERLRRLRQYGWDNQRQALETGVNSRLDSLQAAILEVKLSHLDADNARRAALAERYREGLSDLPVRLPSAPSNGEHVYHLYVIACAQRDELIAHLAKNGVGTAIHYREAVHQQAGYRDRIGLPSNGLPVTEDVVRAIVSLPMFPELDSRDVAHVIKSVRSFYRA